jgi:hypothetical protein
MRMTVVTDTTDEHHHGRIKYFWDVEEITF